MSAPAPTRRAVLALTAGVVLSLSATLPAADAPATVTVDWATYNPVSLVLRERGLLEQALAPHGSKVRWVQSQGSNKALEFLNAGALDFGSTAGGAALLGRLNGNPIQALWVYSQPEWATLVVAKDSPLTRVADLRGKRVAVTRGTDPHIFLLRALETAGLTERDLKIVPLQHADGRAALLRGDVDAWAGLDPLTAAAELEHGARLLYRNAGYNSWGVLNVRSAFAAEHPEVVEAVVGAYTQARDWALANPAALTELLAKETGLPAAVIERQLERTRLDTGPITADVQAAVRAAGTALQSAGVVPAEADVEGAAKALFAAPVRVAATR